MIDALRPFFETDPEDVDDIVGTDEDVEPEPEPEPEPEAWAPSQEEWQQVTQFIGQAAPVLNQIAETQYREQYPEPQGPQMPDPEDFDPFDPEGVQQYINQAVAYGVTTALQNQIGPYEGVLSHVAAQQGEQLARTELDKIQGEIGSFDHDSAFLVASGMIEQGIDPVVALRQAATYAKEMEDRIRTDERTKYKTELQNLSNAPRQTPAGSLSGDTVETVPTGRGRYEEAVRRALANRQPSFPTG